MSFAPSSRGPAVPTWTATLARVSAPTLLIVGERDDIVIEMNQEAMLEMAAEVRLEIVRGVTHLFEAPGALERVADLAGTWFDR